MTTVTAPVWLLAVLGVLAVCGFVGVCWVAAGWAERTADWWHGRRAAAHDENDRPLRWPASSRIGESRQAFWDRIRQRENAAEPLDDLPPPLPPERTWEQMTSHQLPLEGTGREQWGPGTTWRPLTAERERVVPSLLGSRQATAHFRRLERARKRRFMVVSAEILGAYAAVGLEGTGFTRAMAARVRELAP